MKEMSASEAARRFSAVLDGAEQGDTVVITRGGRRVALIVPAPRANGGAVAGVLQRWQSRLGIDDEFAANVAAAGDLPDVLTAIRGASDPRHRGAGSRSPRSA